MSTSPVREAKAGVGVTLDQWVALNDEIAALARAGLPLERGLLAVGRDLPGRLGKLAVAVGRRMNGGETLPDALRAEGEGLSPAYRAAVEAGLRSGKLPAALEGLADYARGYQELRRAIGLAFLYPLIVLFFAHGLFVAFVILMVPRFQQAFASLQLPGGGALALLDRMGGTAPYWAPAVPAVLLLLTVVWFRSGRAAALDPGRAGGLLRRVPWMRRMLADAEAANFAELLGLLVGHDVPLTEALPLAAEASGGAALRKAALGAGEAVRGGESPREVWRSPAARGLPPFVRWAFSAGQARGALVPALKHAAESYRRRALREAESARAVLPVLLLVGIGASATLAYALVLFVPFTNLLKELAD